MDADTKSEDVFHQQQSLFAKQMQADDARLQTEEGSFEDLEFFFNLARDSLESWNGPIPSEEKAIFEKLKEHYVSEQAKQKQPEDLSAENILDGSKRRRASSSPRFVQQHEPGHDAESDPANDLTGSKRKRGEMLEEESKDPRPVGMNETVKQSLRRLVADAPPEKQQTAIQDGARMLHAIKQFPSGSIKYLGGDLWSVEGLTTPIKHHQLIHAGWMNERETSTRGPKGGILADMMGLGKTLCSLTSMVHGKTPSRAKESTTNLVVVPKSLKDQWIIEARKHTVRPTSDSMLGLRAILPYSTESSSEAQMMIFEATDLVVATYPELISAFRNVRYPKELAEASDTDKEKYFNKSIRPKLPALFRFKFRAVYLDEGHLIRNDKTICSIACHKLISKYRWILTGTPMFNDPTDLYSVLDFVRHPTVFKLTFKGFKTLYKGVEDSDDDVLFKKDKKEPKDNGGWKRKKYKRRKDTKDDKKINYEWVATLLHETMRSWTYNDELFGYPLTNIPDSLISEQSRSLSVPESAIYSVVHERLKQVALEASRYVEPDAETEPKPSTGKDSDLDAEKTYKFVAGLFMVLRQMTGHVLVIRPAAFKYLTDEDMNTISKMIDSAPARDPFADDYIAALRKLQRSTTCTICEKRTQDILWAACYHAYCAECLAERMHLAAERGLSNAQCEICKLPVGQLTESAQEAKDEKPRWLNEGGKVIPSTKSSGVVELLKTWRDPLAGDPTAKAVVFTSFKESHKLLKATLEQENWNFTTLTSDMSNVERNESVSRFKLEPEIYIMLATSGVGGTGLNLMNAK
jgi:SNF2 family DNA or RNA helicase